MVMELGINMAGLAVMILKSSSKLVEITRLFEIYFQFF